ncbi:MAG TPA: RodZ domain-containing protein [Anaerolineales bacterium]|jgi:cytoskeletal protein RodZ
MEDLGRLLRETREKLGLTHQEAERATKIRQRYLEALERGELEMLPSAVQARGFLKNYADYLGLDADEIVAAYDGGRTVRIGRWSRRPADLNPPSQPSVQVSGGRLRWLSSDLLVAGGITLAVLFVVVWGVTRVMASLEASSQEQQPAGLLVLSSPSATASETPLPAPTLAGAGGPVTEPSATPEGTLPPELTGLGQPTEGANLRLLVERRSWVEVEVDGEIAYQGRAAPGEILEFQATELIRVLTGNGAGLRVVFNGEDQGRLGDLGQVVTRIWGVSGVMTATPTMTSTPSPTVPASPTSAVETTAPTASPSPIP